ncbi:MAG: GNAT family N-acetyltransferase, partial [Rikenellaceae bacterium]
PLYHHCAVMDGDSFIGLLMWWDFEESLYIEHLATLPSLRGRSYGEKILEDLKAKTTKPIILEVEIPTCEIQHRRIGFYSRVGFKLSPLEYSHPPYSLDSDTPVELQIMSYPNEINTKELAQFKQHLPEIHFIHIY